MLRVPPKPLSERFPNITALGRITTPYGGSTRYEDFHPAVDIANIKGTKIPAPISGVVQNVTIAPPNDKGYGNSVMIRDNEGNFHKFSHLNRPYVKNGQKIRQGDVIGEMGNTGSAYSPSGEGDGTHLDYRIVNAYGKYKNPMVYIKRLYGIK